MLEPSSRKMVVFGLSEKERTEGKLVWSGTTAAHFLPLWGSVPLGSPIVHPTRRIRNDLSLT